MVKNGVFIFGDSGLNENPDPEQLSEIAISSSKSFKHLVGKEAKVAIAFLFYIWKCSFRVN